MEAFYSLQGEGYHQGKAAYFIRLGGCGVGCTWCDVKESWDGARHPLRTPEYIVREAKQFPARLAVVTGGEPLMQDCLPLTRALKREGYHIHLETSGAYPLSGEWDWICLSPKKFKAPLLPILSQADELKVVVYHPSDLKWAESYGSRVSGDCRRFLQPEWGKSASMTPLIVDYIKDHPEWNFSLQLHKYLGVP